MSAGTPRVQPVFEETIIPIPAGTTQAARDFLIPRTLHLDNGAGAAAVLPGAGAFTNQSAFSIPAGTKNLTFYCVYTRGTDGGFPIFRVLWGNGTEEGRAIVIDTDSLVVAGDEGEFDVLRSEPQGPPPQTGSAIEYVFPFDVNGGATTVRIIAAEQPVTAANPGSLLITLTGSG